MDSSHHGLNGDRLNRVATPDDQRGRTIVSHGIQIIMVYGQTIPAQLRLSITVKVVYSHFSK